LIDLDPDFFCSSTRSQWLRELRLNIPWTKADLASVSGVVCSNVVRRENNQVPVPKPAGMVVFLANVIRDSGDSSRQMMTWPERAQSPVTLPEYQETSSGYCGVCKTPLALRCS